MIQHIVLVKWSANVTEEQALAACRHLETFPDQIPGVERIHVGHNVSAANHGYTHALIVQITDEQALKKYLVHPVRMKLLEDHLFPIEAERIEIDVPADLEYAGGDPQATGWHWGIGPAGLLELE